MIKSRHSLVDNFAINNELMCGKSGKCTTRKMTAKEKKQYKNKPAKIAFAFGAIGRASNEQQHQPVQQLCRANVPLAVGNGNLQRNGGGARR